MIFRCAAADMLNCNNAGDAVSNLQSAKNLILLRLYQLSLELGCQRICLDCCIPEISTGIYWSQFADRPCSSATGFIQRCVLGCMCQSSMLRRYLTLQEVTGPIAAATNNKSAGTEQRVSQILYHKAEHRKYI